MPDSTDTAQDASIASAQGLVEISEADLTGIDPDTTNEDSKDSDTKDAQDGDTKDGDTKDDTDAGKSDTSDGDTKNEDGSTEDGDTKDGDTKSGDTGDDSGTKKGDSTAKDTANEDSKDGNDKKGDETVKERTTAASKSKADKPPKGFVPTKALHEARDENSFLKGQMKQMQEQFMFLQKQISSEKGKVDSDLAAEFKELSETEYANLVDNSPAEALLYMQQLNKFQQLQHIKERETEEETRNETVTTQIMASATNAMAELVPGLFDKESEAHDELVDFAGTLGFSEDMFYLTHPGTQVILPGETEALLLGDQATSILKVLVTAKEQVHKKVSAVDKDVMTKLKAEIQAKVEKELLEKFKTDKDATFKSLQQLSKAKDVTDFGDKVLSDTQFAKLSDADQERYLSGT